MPAHDNPRVGNLEDALANLNIAVRCIVDSQARLGYTIDPLVKRWLETADSAILTAQHYTSSELVQGRRVAR